MKKLTRLMALLLSSLMIFALFTACGSDIQETTAITGEALLIGDWDAIYDVSGLDFYVQFTFNADGTMKTSITEESYNKTIENANEEMKALLSENLPYEDISYLFNSTGTWKLDGNTLSMTMDGETQTAETGLSEGKRTFILEDDGAELVFNKK